MRLRPRWIAAGGGVLFLGLQLVPYGWWHDNPPVVRDAPWPDEESEGIARESCYDCHSNETNWPIYSYVAPMSWLTRQDVENGREELNFSNWDEFSDEADDAIDVIEDGSMPPSQYTWVHRDAPLSEDEAARLTAALAAMEETEDEDDDNSGPG